MFKVGRECGLFCTGDQEKVKQNGNLFDKTKPIFWKKFLDQVLKLKMSIYYVKPILEYVHDLKRDKVGNICYTFLQVTA